MNQTAEEMLQEAQIQAAQIFQQVDMLKKENGTCTRQMLIRAYYAALLIADDERALKFQAELSEMEDTE